MENMYIYIYKTTYIHIIASFCMEFPRYIYANPSLGITLIELQEAYYNTKLPLKVPCVKLNTYQNMLVQSNNDTRKRTTLVFLYIRIMLTRFIFT